MGNRFLTEYRPELGTLLLVLFGISTFIGVVGVFAGPHPNGILSIFEDLVVPFGNWIYWLLVVGALGLAFTLWWVLDYVTKVRKLRDLIDTTSKAKFLKNFDDIEYLAWRLPKRYKIIVNEKKRDLKIRQ